MAKDHTHVLTRPFSVRNEDGERETLESGTPFTPTENQLRAMPDMFARVGPVSAAPEGEGGAAPKRSAPDAEITAEDVEQMTVKEIRDLVDGVGDKEFLLGLRDFELQGKARSTAVEAIDAAIVAAQQAEE